MWRLLPLVLATACRPAKEAGNESPPGDDSDPGHSDSVEPELGFDLIYSVAEDQVVRRVHMPPGFEVLEPSALDVVWEWQVQSTWPELRHKPHGLTPDGDALIVAVLDYFTDAGVLVLDLETGAAREELVRPADTPWAGQPVANSLRFTHNTIRDGDLYISSDTHNQRVIATDAAWNLQWELSRETLSDPTLRTLFSQPNDVERITVGGEERLLVSTRGDYCNFVLLFGPTTPLRPGEPPWELVFSYPPEANASILLENHNPRPLADGSGFTVADSGHDRVLAVSWSGELVWSLPAAECAGPSPLNWPRDAVLTPDGKLLVGDTLNNRIVLLDPEIPCPTEDDILWKWEGLQEPYQVLVLPEEGS